MLIYHFAHAEAEPAGNQNTALIIVLVSLAALGALFLAANALSLPGKNLKKDDVK